MKKTALCTAILAIYALSMPAFADELSDLKAEIAAQRQAAAAQQARLDALEQKLNGVQQQQAAAKTAAAPASAGAAGVSFTQGEGLSYVTANGSVALYGLIDVSYVHVNHANASGWRASTRARPATWTPPVRCSTATPGSASKVKNWAS
jgi:uncharacterized coiled-coil protein SlyX